MWCTTIKCNSTLRTCHLNWYDVFQKQCENQGLAESVKLIQKEGLIGNDGHRLPYCSAPKVQYITWHWMAPTYSDRPQRRHKFVFACTLSTVSKMNIQDAKCISYVCMYVCMYKGINLHTTDSSSIDSCCTHSMHTGRLWHDLQPTSSKHGPLPFKCIRMYTYVPGELNQWTLLRGIYNPYAEVSHNFNVTVFKPFSHQEAVMWWSHDTHLSWPSEANLVHLWMHS